MDGISNPEVRSPNPAALMGAPAAFLLLSGCFSLNLTQDPVRTSAPKEGRLLLHVTEEGARGLLGARDLDGVKITVRSGSDTIARATTHTIGAVGLEFLAPVEAQHHPPTSALPFEIRPWVTLTFEKDGYRTLELPLQPEDFVETRELRLLTRGVALRRAS